MGFLLSPFHLPPSEPVSKDGPQCITSLGVHSLVYSPLKFSRAGLMTHFNRSYVSVDSFHCGGFVSPQAPWSKSMCRSHMEGPRGEAMWRGHVEIWSYMMETKAQLVTCSAKSSLPALYAKAQDMWLCQVDLVAQPNPQKTATSADIHHMGKSNHNSWSSQPAKL